MLVLFIGAAGVGDVSGTALMILHARAGSGGSGVGVGSGGC